MRILIISLHAGEGHVKAAQGLEEAFKANYPLIKVKRVDFFDYSSHLIEKIYGELYLAVATHAPHLHNFLYGTLNKLKSDGAHYGRIIFDALNAQPLLKLVEEYDPEVVVVTHPVPGAVINMFQKKKRPLVVVITDYELHRLWRIKNVSLYFVASEDVKRQLIEEGVDSSKISTFGIPLRIGFAKQETKQAIRKRLGFSDLFTVFILAGSFGVSPAQEILQSMNKINLPFQVIVVTGRNDKMFSAIEKSKASFSFPLYLFGFTEQISDLMSASDVLISKPGGVTVTETLAKLLPMIMIKGFGGQEEANIRFLLKHKCALYAPDNALIPTFLTRMVKKPLLLKSFQERMRPFSNPDSSFKIAEAIWKKILI